MQVADIQYIRPSKDRDADARAHAALLGHVLGPWFAPDGGLWCYYAMAACVHCGSAFYIAYEHVDTGHYDGWASYETCAQTRTGRSSEGKPSIWSRATIPGPKREETRQSP